jgi:Holliday junction resolvase-like predicted endonuclease
MNASEKLVNAWLQSKGYFTATNIPCGKGQEIDILAVKPKDNDMIHVEVHVSVKPVGPVARSREYANDSFGQRITNIVEHSFTAKRKFVIERFGSDRYRLVHVRSKRIVKQDMSLEDLKHEFLKHDVELVYIENILVDLMKDLKGRSFDETMNFVQLFKEFGS